MNKYIILAIILSLFYMACKTKKTENIIYLDIDNKQQIVELESDSLYNTLLNPKHIYQPPFKEYFYSFDIENRVLYKYTFGEKKFSKIIDFNIDNQLYIISFNIDNQERYISFIIDDTNKENYILDVYTLEGNRIYQKEIPQHSEYVLGGFFPHVLTDTFQLFSHCMRINGGYPYSAKFPTYNIQMHWDIKNDVMEILPITYPKSYFNKYFGYSYSINRSVINDSIHAFSFNFNDSIFLYNINSKKTSAYDAKSRQANDFPNIGISELSSYHSEIQQDIVHNCPAYFQMSYLPQQEVYVRFFKNEKGKMSQIIYDKDFKYIGELTDNLKYFFDSKNSFKHLGLKDGLVYLEEYSLKVNNQEISDNNNFTKYNKEKYLKENFDASVQKFLEKTKLIPNKEDSIIIYQSEHCSACVKNKALSFLQEKDNKNISIIVFDEKDKEMLSSHIFLSPIVLCEDNSLSKDGYYHHMPHMYFWKGNKVTSSPIVEEKIEENI